MLAAALKRAASALPWPALAALWAALAGLRAALGGIPGLPACLAAWLPYGLPGLPWLAGLAW